MENKDKRRRGERREGVEGWKKRRKELGERLDLLYDRSIEEREGRLLYVEQRQQQP